LPEARIIGERGRTVSQLNMFGGLVRDGSWLEASIDTAEPNRQPIPKPDIRRMLIPIGPVVVFAASNFPLAFSTAGGDTASALAAGNPVIVKAHSSHLGTSALIGSAIIKAAENCEMPDGVFSMLFGSGRIIGQALINHPSVKAVGFTGSRTAGRLLFDIASQRDEPIPFFAEMGSINPTLILPEAMKNMPEKIAKLLAGSINLGTGQFCTNPGLLLLLKCEGYDRFIDELNNAISLSDPAVMLNENIYKSFEANKKSLLNQPNVHFLAKSGNIKSGPNIGIPTIASVDAVTFLDNADLSDEIFGPFSLIVRCSNKEELQVVIEKMEGQLTATIFSEPSETSSYNLIINALKLRVGRIIYNGVPTGVEVCDSMQHGGPYPASSDSRFTSVGTGAIKRFTRPIAFQNCSNGDLPDELKNENKLNIWRTIDTMLTKEIIRSI
jgi:NADP-dependent aldehyde dehydrogenase